MLPNQPSYLRLVVVLSKRTRHELIILSRVKVTLQQLVQQFPIHCLGIGGGAARHLLDGCQPRLNLLAFEVFQPLDLLTTLRFLRLLSDTWGVCGIKGQNKGSTRAPFKNTGTFMCEFAQINGRMLCSTCPHHTSCNVMYQSEL